MRGHPWEAALEGVRAEALDCLQTTPALLAEAAHGPGAHLALGCHWRFPARRHDGSIALPAGLGERLEQAGRLLGLACAEPEGPLDAAGLERRLGEAVALYVVADAYDLPWVPYAGHRHMDHGFLLASWRGRLTVVDAYHNDTEWGPARPGAWQLAPGELAGVARRGAHAIAVEPAAAPPRVDARAARDADVARARAAEPDIAGYVAALRSGLGRSEAVERLVLDIWLLGRERLLHGAWLDTQPAAGEAARAEVAARVDAWRELAARSYLALRRFQRGGLFDVGVADDVGRLLREDAACVLRLGAAGHASGGRPAVAAAVAEAVRTVLGVDDLTLREARELRDLPGFDSFRLVEIVDRAQRRLGVALPAEVAAGDLRDVDGLVRLLTRAAGGAGAAGERA